MPLISAYSPALKTYFDQAAAGLPLADWETPFVCDECGGYFHGGELAASNPAMLVCAACASPNL